MTNVFIVGSKGIPAKYGGFETFVENLTKGKTTKEIKYHVSCMNNVEKHFAYNDADCFNVRLPFPGAPGRIFHVGLALKQVEEYAKKHQNEQTIVYILGCRVGPLLIYHSHILHRLNVRIFCNPDGLEWKRSKWNSLAKVFLRYCEKCLVVNSDLAICDSKNIEKYIIDTYHKSGKTEYIAYGADVKSSLLSEEEIDSWFQINGIKREEYYLIVGRFVPENNYETMISEFISSNTQKKLVIVSNVERNAFYTQLLEKTKFDKDNRVLFVGTVYDQELLKKIRENAFAYIHGHEVGGTNPSLLEALASTKMNLLLDVGFNREVAEDTALYWTKEAGSLKKCIEESECFTDKERKYYGNKSKNRIKSCYSWETIVHQYEKVFLDNKNVN